MLKLLHRATLSLFELPRRDDQIPEGLDWEAYHVVDVIQLDRPAVDPGEQAIPRPPEIEMTDPDGQGVNGQVILGWDVVPLPLPTPEPQWLSFVSWLYGQPLMMAAMASARQSTIPQGEPATTALPAALEAARTEQNYPAFALTWGQFFLASGLPLEALAPIVAKAIEMNLPPEFIAALQPTP